MTVTLYNLDCRDALDLYISPESIDSIVTDPPYGIGFMGKAWDHGVPGVEFWKRAYDALKPGGHLLAFSGARTYHRMASAIEDAGFEIRDQIMWVYGSGFPKSLDVSKQIDQQEKNRWVKISKAIDNASLSEIAELWLNSKNANAAGLSFQRKQTEAGLNTQKNCFAHGSVLLQASHKSCDALAVIAELNLIEAHPTSEGNCSSAQPNAERAITALRSRANTAGSSQENHEATRCMADFSALQNAWGWQDESKADKLKAVEALKTWLGSKQSSRPETTSALCAALTDDLKLITLSRSKTFLSFDTTRQTACASAISVTITESTAESLISFTADTLRNKAIDKAAGAERGTVRVAPRPESSGTMAGASDTRPWIEKSRELGYHEVADKNPVTAAAAWDGWGTALKPAHEPICVARKPFNATVAENVQAHGTGVINIDGCRVPGESTQRTGSAEMGFHGGNIAGAYETGSDIGRWPANLIHDGSDEVVALFPDSKGQQGDLIGHAKTRGNGIYGDMPPAHDAVARVETETSAARFFYCAKASKKDREVGNNHPTVKPTELMRYLTRLVTPPGGTVLDMFMGSGSTGKAALLEGFKFIGIEMDDESFATAQRRVAA